MKIDLDTTFTNVIGDPNNIVISCIFLNVFILEKVVLFT